MNFPGVGLPGCGDFVSQTDHWPARQARLRAARGRGAVLAYATGMNTRTTRSIGFVARTSYALFALSLCVAWRCAVAQDATPLSFAVSYDPSVCESYTGRVYVMLSSNIS